MPPSVARLPIATPNPVAGLGAGSGSTSSNDSVLPIRQAATPIFAYALSAFRRLSPPLAFPLFPAACGPAVACRGGGVDIVAVNGARNAALLAVRIMALSDERLAAELKRFVQDLADQVRDMDAEIVARYPAE